MFIRLSGRERAGTKETYEELDWLFRKMVRKFVKERDKITVEGVALPGLMVLHKIDSQGEQRLTDLAEELDFTSGAITALCDKLEERGYAVRVRKQGDRRTVWLNITPDGLAMLERNANIGPRSIAALFHGFSDSDLKQQKQIYERMINNLEGFSETILTLAQENAVKKEPAVVIAGEKQQRSRTQEQNRWVGY
ncbi:MarR family winged helix-turn-helix transcriptional regulator [Paenibacillus kobensis]|uniref:MarR family winged helix-turn-helix transcriptional regulator n=1 Tax=Paenibacillus kobensis TaxID=59841 RepID=UPI0027D8814A|nr:MarR family transcriptional regulator [Paenibacillus kobensis]